MSILGEKWGSRREAELQIAEIKSEGWTESISGTAVHYGCFGGTARDIYMSISRHKLAAGRWVEHDPKRLNQGSARGPPVLIWLVNVSVTCSFDKTFYSSENKIGSTRIEFFH